MAKDFGLRNQALYLWTVAALETAVNNQIYAELAIAECVMDDSSSSSRTPTPI